MKKVKSLLSLVLAVIMVAGCLVTANAATISEIEPNNSAATATSFNVGDTVKGKIEADGEKDYFEFKATKTGNATVTIKHLVNEAASTYFTVEVQTKDAEPRTLATFASAGNKAEENAVLSVDKDESYVVVVKQGDICDATLEYQISVAIATVALAESEPNDSATEADTLEYSPSGTPKEYYGSIGKADKDYYKVTIPSDGVINLYLYNYASNAGNYKATLMTYVEVDGVQEITEITSIEIADTAESKTGPSVGVAKGTYYLLIEGIGDSIGSYKTRILFRSVENVETEINDTLAKADAISAGKTYKGTLDSAADKDYFKLTVTADKKNYDFAAKSTKAGDWTFALLTSDGNKAAEPVVLKATNDSKEAKAVIEALPAGTYYVAVSVTAGGIHNEDIYEFSITEKAEDTETEDKEETPNLLERIFNLNWGGLWENFSGWIEEINFIGMFASFGEAFIYFFTIITSFLG